MIYRFGAFILDTGSCSIHRAGEPVHLQRRVFDLIAYLVEHADRLVPKEELFERVWGGVAVSEASLSQAVKHARRALDDDADQPAFIVTVRGRGYRFAGAVERPGSTPPPARPDPPPPAPPSAARAGAGQEALLGRDASMKVLAEGLQDAVEGRGRLFLIGGEPGIGKTRVLDELARIAAERGARVLVGRCHEGDEGAPVLWPWVQVLRAASALDPEGFAILLKERGGALPDLAPERAPEPGADPPDPLRARFQLFDAIASFVIRASRAAPLAILFDDLHRADEPSILMLKFLARVLHDARVLAVGTHRSAAAGARGAIAALAREPVCRSIALDGLGEEDVRRFLGAGLGAPAADDLVRAARAQTGGNPFFLTQVVHAIAARGAPVDAAALPALVLRSSAGDAILAHVDHLSPACREVLTAASVLGVAFASAPLGEAIGLPPDALLGALGEAIAGGVVARDEPRAGRFRFTHALIREALYAAIPLPERGRLHERIGEALAAREEGGAAFRLAEIAYHFLQSAPAGQSPRAVDYAVRAAEEAARRGAHEDAARLYERALEALDLGPSDPMRRVEVMLALGNARFRAGDLPRSKEVFEQSARIARALGRGDKLAEAALGYALEDERSAVDRRRIAFLEEGLGAIADGSEARRALLTGRLAVAQYFTVDAASREKLGREAVEAARRSGDPAAIAFALRCLHFVLLAPDTAEERCAVSNELVALSGRLDDREGELRAIACRIVDRLELGRIAEADADIAAYGRVAAELGQPAYQWSALLYRAGRALASGPVDRARALLHEAAAPGTAGARGPLGAGVLVLLFQLHRAEGRLAEIADEVRASAARSPDRPLRRALAAIVDLETGDAPSASRELAALTAGDLAGIRVDLDWLGTIALLAEAAFALGDAPCARLLHGALRPYAGRLALAGYGAACVGPVSFHLGITALASGDDGAAERYLEDAAAETRARGMAPFEARARWARAELHRRRSSPGDAARARELAGEALAAARQLGLVELAGRAAETLGSAPYARGRPA